MPMQLIVALAATVAIVAVVFFGTAWLSAALN